MIVFLEGFDVYPDSTTLHRKGWGTWIYPERCTFVEGRRANSRALSMNNNQITKYLDASTASMTIGFALKQPGLYSGYLWNCGAVTTAQTTVFTNTRWSIVVPASLSFYNQYLTPTTYTYNNCLTINTWQYVELKVEKTDTTTIAWEVHVNGVYVGSGSGTNANLATYCTAFNAIEFSRGDETQIDDLYVSNGVAPNAGFLGDCAIDTIYPIADTGTEQWLWSVGEDSFALIDDHTEVGGFAPDDDETFIYSSTATNETICHFSDIQVTGGFVRGVATNLLVRKTDAGYRTISSSITTGDGKQTSTAVGVPNNYTIKQHIFNNTMSGSGDWTQAKVNALQCGIKLEN